MDPYDVWMVEARHDLELNLRELTTDQLRLNLQGGWWSKWGLVDMS